MNIKILKKFTNQDYNFPILNKIYINKNIAVVTNMEDTVQMILPKSFPTGCYTWNSLQLGLKGLEIKPDQDNTDYPEILKSSNEIIDIINKEDLVKIHKTLSNDTSQYTLNGFLYEQGDLISLDGRRLTLIQRNNTIEKSIIIKSIVQYLPFLDNRIKLSINIKENKIFFINKNDWLSTSILNGKFPNYKLFIPNTTKFNLQIDFDLLKEALHNLKPFLDPECNKIYFDIYKNKTILMCHNIDIINIPVYEIESICNTETRIGINYKLFNNFIENENEIKFNDGLSPLIISKDNIVKIIMPMKTDDEQIALDRLKENPIPIKKKCFTYNLI